MKDNQKQRLLTKYNKMQDLINGNLTFEEELELARQRDQEYLDSIDPKELALAKEMFSKVSIPVSEPFQDFMDNLIDFTEDTTDGIDDSNDN